MQQKQTNKNQKIDFYNNTALENIQHLKKKHTHISENKFQQFNFSEYTTFQKIKNQKTLFRKDFSKQCLQCLQTFRKHN